MDPSSLISPRTTTTPLPAAASLTSPEARNQALLDSFADLSPTPDLTPGADSPSFLSQPFTPSAVLGNTQSFRARQQLAKCRAAPSPPQANDPTTTHSASLGKKARHRRRSSSNPKFHSQPRSRRSSYTPLSARRSSFVPSPRSKDFSSEMASPTLSSLATSSSFPPSPGLSSKSTCFLGADDRPQRRSSLCQSLIAHPPPAGVESDATPDAARRPHTRKAPPPEIIILNPTPSSARLLELRLQRSPSTSSAHSGRSDWALSLGAFETLPIGYQLQPSPPTSPGVSPTAVNFGSLASGPYGRPRTTRLYSTSSLSLDRYQYSPPRTPLAGARRRSYTSPMRQALPTRAAATTHNANNAEAGDRIARDIASKRMLTAREKEQAKREKERRRMAEQARPLPYAKKVEIEEFLGNLPAKPKKTRQPGSKDVVWRGETATRHVGAGRSTQHVSEDGNVWLDLEEEQEWAWLLSEVGKGGQPLPHWPQQFTSHLRRTSDVKRGRGLRAADADWSVEEIILETTYASDDGDLNAWIGDSPEKLVSVFSLKKDGTPRRPAEPASERQGLLASSTTDGRRSATPPLLTSLDLRALQQHGKTDFLSSTFAPTSPSNSIVTLPASPITPTDDHPLPAPSIKPRSSSWKSERPPNRPSKPSTGAISKMKGFLKKVAV